MPRGGKQGERETTAERMIMAEKHPLWPSAPAWVRATWTEMAGDYAARAAAYETARPKKADGTATAVPDLITGPGLREFLALRSAKAALESLGSAITWHRTIVEREGSGITKNALLSKAAEVSAALEAEDFILAKSLNIELRAMRAAYAAKEPA